MLIWFVVKFNIKVAQFVSEVIHNLFIFNNFDNASEFEVMQLISALMNIISSRLLVIRTRKIVNNFFLDKQAFQFAFSKHQTWFSEEM